MCYLFKNDVLFVLKNLCTNLLHKILCIIVLTLTLGFLHPYKVFAATETYSGNLTISLSDIDLRHVTQFAITGKEYIDSKAIGNCTYTLKDKYSTVIASDTFVLGTAGDVYTWVTSTEYISLPVSGYDLSNCTFTAAISYVGQLSANGLQYPSISVVLTSPDAPICDTNLP